MSLESELVNDIADELARRGFLVRREVNCLLPTWDGSDQKRRIDLYVKSPATWDHHRLWTMIAIEAKRRDGGDMGGEVDGMYQVGSVMFARDFRQADVNLPRPSVGLYVDADTWTPENQTSHTRETMLADRILWRVGCAVLRRDYRGEPFFLFAGTGRLQTTYRFPPRVH